MDMETSVYMLHTSMVHWRTPGLSYTRSVYIYIYTYLYIYIYIYIILSIFQYILMYICIYTHNSVFCATSIFCTLVFRVAIQGSFVSHFFPSFLLACFHSLVLFFLSRGLEVNPLSLSLSLSLSGFTSLSGSSLHLGVPPRGGTRPRRPSGSVSSLLGPHQFPVNALSALLIL